LRQAFAARLWQRSLVRLIVQPKAAAATRPSDAASASTTKSSTVHGPAGRQELQQFDHAGEAMTKAVVGRRLRV